MKNKFNLHTMNKKYAIGITILFLMTIVIGIIIGVNNLKKQEETTEEQMAFITNEGNIIYTEYQDLGKFYIKIPKDFNLLSKEILEKKYPVGNIPKKAYSNEDASINIVYNAEGTSLNGRKLTKYVESVKAMFSQMGYIYYYTPIEVNGYEIHTISLVTKAIDTNIYNHMAIFSVDNEVMTLSFNCTENYQREWSEVANFIIESIKVK